MHLDLKPDNVILRPDGSVALIDFGLAHHARFPDLLAEEQRMAAGSAPYISPEQVLGERSDPRSDLFALGAMLYELCTGKLPFGIPRTRAGLRDRLWLDPMPPRRACARRAALAAGSDPALPRAAAGGPLPVRGASSPSTCAIRKTCSSPRARPAGTPSGVRRPACGAGGHARDVRPRTRSLPAAQVSAARVVLAAIDTTNLDDERHPAVLQRGGADPVDSGRVPADLRFGDRRRAGRTERRRRHPALTSSTWCGCATGSSRCACRQAACRCT